MSDTAKLFTTGRSQAVRLPKEYRFEGSEVFIRRDPATGDVLLLRALTRGPAFLTSTQAPKYRPVSCQLAALPNIEIEDATGIAQAQR